ncbi:solute carrier family 22 member 5-like isoform X1 [Kryptolebias marmoratus]|uniref:solute carrier family 22 member 5-like isoform X1 n=1 Tax=Kryptolebias marmoratus TaxID=37003 RepID=UPI0007F89AA9|nr:solute carrier family 22 member 5-like isoform X1 [Kryptolebias marmoratus]
MLPDSSSSTNKVTDYDTATAFLGQWGRFQQKIFFLTSLCVIPNGFLTVAFVFLAATPAHRCLLPAHLNLSAAWRNSSVPLEEEDGGAGPVPSRCSRYKLDYLLNYSDRGLLPGLDVNLSDVPTEGCLDGWEYDRSDYSSTIVTEWNMVCDDSWKKPLTSSFFYFGVLIGSFLSGQISDRYGRKRALFIAIALQAITAFILVFSPNWTTFCILYLIVGLEQISIYVVAFVLGTELLARRTRAIFSTAGTCIFFAVGYMILPLFAFYIRDWRMFFFSITMPGSLRMILWWFIPESPRWLLSQGRIEEAKAIITNAAKMNNVEPPAVIFSHLQNEDKSEDRRAYNICDLFRFPNIRWISITLWLIWNTLTIGYFALSLNTGNLSGNAYFNCFLSAAVEIPAYVLSWALFRWCSRRLSVSSSLLTGGAFLLLTQLVPAHLFSLSTTFEMTGKFAVSTSFAVVYAYTAELYPTVLRNTAVGSCSMAARIGSIIAPYFVYLRTYSVSLPYILMGSLTTLAGLLSLLLPETYGMPLPETISHMQHFPGCCRKSPHTTRQTKKGEKAAEETSLVGQI